MDDYTVMGNPIEQSLSPNIHRLFAQQTHQLLTYDKTWVPLNGFKDAVNAFIQRGGKGANVTAPFKKEAFHLADKHSTRALSAESVNTLIINKNGLIEGDNTDGVGFVRDLQQNHHFLIKGKRILIVGRGGAAMGILPAIEAEQPADVLILSRHDQHPLKKTINVDLIINATSAGLEGKIPTLPASLKLRETFCYDLSYGEAAKPFVQWANAQGAYPVVDGLGMLVEQAAEAFFLWRGVRPDTAQIDRLRLY